MNNSGLERGAIEMAKLRGTAHNGRSGKSGVYSVKHNDRNFDLEKAEHIDQEKTHENWYWHMYQLQTPELTFEQVEDRFYRNTFSDALTAKNERYQSDGHRERMRTMDEYRTAKNSCPEETIFQIGKMGDTIDAETLKKICIDHISWEQDQFPNVKVLDVALHVDEEGAPHMHERKVWMAHSKDGMIVGQAKALEEMGVKRPHPEKAKDRYNNSKVTYTAMCRNHFLETCRSYGIDIEEVPDKVSKRGLELEEYKRKQEEQKLKVAEEKYSHLTELLSRANEQLLKLDHVQEQIKIATDQLEKILDMKARASEIKKIFGDKDVVTYHRSMIESTRSIGREAREVLLEVQKKEKELADMKSDLAYREKLIRSMEEEIAPLHAKASKKMQEAEAIKENLEDIVLERAKGLLADRMLQEDDMSDRMTDFMSRYKIGEKSLSEIFHLELAKEIQERQRALERSYRSRGRERLYDDLEL